MASKIESVYVYTIIYKDGRRTRLEFDVYYKSGRTFKPDEENIPLTVINFVMTAKTHEKIKTEEKANVTIITEKFKEG